MCNYFDTAATAGKTEAFCTLMRRLADIVDQRLEQLTRWCLKRQAMGFCFTGSPNKPEDTCYSFWVRATLSLHSRKHVVTRVTVCDMFESI